MVGGSRLHSTSHALLSFVGKVRGQLSARDPIGRASGVVLLRMFLYNAEKSFEIAIQ